MALSLILGNAKLTAEKMETSARVTLEQVDGGYAITAVHLTLRAKIPGADQAAAGAIMWVPGSLAFLVPAAWIAVRLLTPKAGAAGGRGSNWGTSLRRPLGNDAALVFARRQGPE